MEEEKKEKKKGGGIFGEKFITFLLGGAGLGYLGKGIVTKLLGKLTEKGVDVAEKKLEKIFLGKDITEAKKSREDEKFWEIVLSQRSDKKEIRKFRSDLRTASPDKSDALVLHVANLITGFRREVRETTYKKKDWSNNKDKKGKGQDRVEEKYDKFDYATVNSFLDSLINDHTEFSDRVRFLEGEEVFSLIPKEKKFVKAVKDAGCRLFDKIATSSVQTTEKTHDNLGKNSEDWTTRSKTAANEAAEDLKNYRENKARKGGAACQ